MTSANITTAALTVTAAGINRTYDGTTAATVTLSDNRVSGDSVTDSYTAATFSDKVIGNNKTVSVSGIAFTDTYSSALFSDVNVGAGKTVTVSGISISGADAGNYSANSSTTATADITPLAPTGLAVVAVTSSSAALAWSASTGFTGYNILREGPGDSSFTQIGTASDPSFTDAGLDSATDYSYEVQATAAGLTSPATDPVSASTAPLAPDSLAFSGTTASSASLTWTASSGTTAYHIERSTDGVSFIEIAANVTTAGYTDLAVIPGYSYFYRVRAERNGSFSDYSITEMATLLPAAPANVMGNFASSTQVNLVWNGSPGAVGYTVWRTGP